MNVHVADSAAGRPSGLDRWLREHAGLLADMRSGAFDLNAELASWDAPVAPGHALLRADRIAAAALSRDGRVVAANAAFERHFGQDAIDRDAAEEAFVHRRAVLARWHRGDEAIRSALVYAPADQTGDWALPPDIRAARALNGVVVVLSVVEMSAAECLDAACAAFGLTPLQTRVTAGLVRTGAVKSAARDAGVSYETAREVVAAAMKLAGVSRLPAFISRIVILALGVPPAGREEDAERALADIWGLTGRQAVLVLRIAQGRTRAEAAAAARLSDAVAKKELGVAFETLGVATAPAIARAVAEANVLAGVTRATNASVVAGEAFHEPLRFVHRPGGGRIAISDYGPRSGRPVLVLHSSSASRPVPARFVEALQALGFRPFAIDRPGFGLTDPPADLAAWRDDPFDLATADIGHVLDALKVKRADIVARGGAQVAVRLALKRPDLIGRVVLLAPDPPSRPEDRTAGPLGAIKQAFLRHPRLIEPMARMIAGQIAGDRIRRAVFTAVAPSRPDTEAMQDPRLYADYARGYRLFASGRVGGYVAEQLALARGYDVPALSSAAHWHVLHGAHDPLHAPDWLAAYWSSRLPGASIERIDDGGRFIVMTHARRCAETLAAAPEPPVA